MDDQCIGRCIAMQCFAVCSHWPRLSRYQIAIMTTRALVERPPNRQQHHHHRHQRQQQQQLLGRSAPADNFLKRVLSMLQARSSKLVLSPLARAPAVSRETSFPHRLISITGTDANRRHSMSLSASPLSSLPRTDRCPFLAPI